MVKAFSFHKTSFSFEKTFSMSIVLGWDIDEPKIFVKRVFTTLQLFVDQLVKFEIKSSNIK